MSNEGATPRGAGLHLSLDWWAVIAAGVLTVLVVAGILPPIGW